MEHLVHAVRKAVADGNHYAALAVALTLPDICGWIQDPASRSRARCEAWFERYLQDQYVMRVGAMQRRQVLLGPGDFYALRCAFLHEGREDITGQNARDVLERFQFVVPPRAIVVHKNLLPSGVLQLQLDLFCEDVASGTMHFLADIADDEGAIGRLNQMLIVRGIGAVPVGNA
jgi:hypothetical protein